MDKERFLEKVKEQHGTIKAYCEALGVSKQYLYAELRKGYNTEKARIKFASALKLTDAERKKIFSII